MYMLHHRRRIAWLMLLALAALWLLPAAAESPSDYNRKVPQVLREGHLYADAAILIDATNGDVLFSKNSKTRMYPASTTKIMTLMLALESGIAMDTQIVIPKAAGQVPSDSSLVPVFPGDVTTFRDLLYGFMLSSGNDGANAVAVIVSGSLDAFVDLMNKRAAQLGCVDTHFANAHGYHNADHYTTAQDMARITQAALRIDAFRQIVSSPSYTMHLQRNGQNIETRVSNGNHLLRKDDTYYYADCIGVKTGYHGAGGHCFVGAAERDGVTLIAVDFHNDSSTHRWVDIIRLFNYGYTCYTAYTLEQMFSMSSGQIATLKVSNAIESDPYGGQLNLKVAQISNPDYTRMVESGNEAAMDAAVADFISRCELVITSDMTAPISEGEIMGKLHYVSQSGEEITATLIADRDIAEQPAKMTVDDLFPFLKYFDNSLVRLLAIVLLLLAVLIPVAIGLRNRRTDRRRMKILDARKRELARQRAEKLRRMRSRRRRTSVRRRSDLDDDDEDEDLFGGW